MKTAMPCPLCAAHIDVTIVDDKKLARPCVWLEKVCRCKWTDAMRREFCDGARSLYTLSLRTVDDAA